MVNNLQRVGAISNAQVGSNFERLARNYFRQIGYGELYSGYSVPIGVTYKKERRFDLGTENPPTLVECKSHTWTSGGNVPSAKLAVWNEAMLFFLLAPKSYRKIMFVLRDFSDKRGETLAEYYIRSYGHLIPGDVVFLEYGGINSVRKLR